MTAYGKIEALKGVSLDVASGSITCLLGPNGAGKTTLMMTIAGVLRPRTGSIRFLDQEITRLQPDAIVRRGIALVPENRLVFASMSVLENCTPAPTSARMRSMPTSRRCSPGSLG